MKKIINLLLFVFIVGTMSECKKGEDDPLISFRTRKARVVGKWKLISGTHAITYSSTSGASSNSSSYSLVYTESLFTVSGSSTSNGNTFAYSDAGVYSYSIEFEKDGTYSYTEIEDGSITIETGIWNFTSRVGDYKNKEQITLTSRTRSTNNGTSTYTGKEPEMSMTLLELRNKKIVISWDESQNSSESYGNSNSTDSYSSKGERVLEQS